MNSTDLSSLLSRAEAATGPDQELDALIMCALVAGPNAYIEQSTINGRWCIYYAPNRIWSMDSRAGTWREGGWSLTASLDAALALCERVLGRDQAECLAQEAFGSTRFIQPLSTAFALALLAAMLKGLIAQGQDGTAERSGVPREAK